MAARLLTTGRLLRGNPAHCNRKCQSVLRIRIRDRVLFLPLDPGWVEVSIRIRDEQPGSYF
jgi:hypothetical protein